MFGLPTHRTSTIEAVSACEDIYGCNPYCPPLLKTALYLAEMKWNHYTLLLTSSTKQIYTWGACYDAGTVGYPTNTAEPKLVNINWVLPKEDISYIRSQGYTGTGSGLKDAWGDGWTLFKTNKGSVYVTGKNWNGAFGSSYPGNTGQYERCLTDVKHISLAGWQHSVTNVYVKNDGRVYALGGARPSGFGPVTTALTTDGSNYIGIDNVKKVWTQVQGDTISQTKTFALKNDGTLWACGYNASGALGVGSSAVHITSWMQVVDQAGVALQNVKEVISSSMYNITCILADGKIYSCGSNVVGGLGLGLATSATRDKATHITAIRNADMLFGGYRYSSYLVSTRNLEVYTWGNNEDGECGVGVPVKTSIDTPTKATTIPAKRVVFGHGGGSFGVCDGCFGVVLEDGSVYVAGSNHQYALGIPTTNNQNVTTFRRNDYFGYNAPLLTEPWRYPIFVGNNIYTSGTTIISGVAPNDFQTKVVNSPGFPPVTENVYVNRGFYVEGPGIQPETKVTTIDRVNHLIYVDKPILTTQNTPVILTYKFFPKAVQLDFCGYPNELSMKVCAQGSDCGATLYQCGWNQLVQGVYNFNPRPAGFPNPQKVDRPTAFQRP